MPLKRLLLAAALAFTFVAVAPAEAAKPGKGGKKGGHATPERILGRFDRDGDGTLSAEEAQRASAVYEALKSLDKDNDGKLSESELATVKPVKRGARKGKAQ